MKLYLAGPTPWRATMVVLAIASAITPRYPLPTTFPVFDVPAFLAGERAADLGATGDASRVLAGGVS